VRAEVLTWFEVDTLGAPIPETLEAAFFKLDDIPWQELSFRSVSTTLEHYLQDRPSGVFTTHHYAIDLRFPD